MQFNFNSYSCPLLFGFIQGWIYALMFWLRAWRQGRWSDALFGVLLAAFTFEIWEYLLGFAGIEVLWNELEFFPRNFTLLIPALSFLYLKSQFNARYRPQWRDLLHLLPFLIYWSYHVLIFIQGPTFVAGWRAQIHYPWQIESIERLLAFALTLVYFSRAYLLYRQYHFWSPNQFSNLETINFKWFRNFLLAYFLSNIVGWSMTLIDLWLQLDFWHDWWDELFNAGLIYYLSIAGYNQTQTPYFQFDPAEKKGHGASKTARFSPEEIQDWQEVLRELMEGEKVYLEPELSLGAVARHLNTNTSVLSAVINQVFGKNFNDFVNAYRVEAVKKLLTDPASAHLSLLGMGLECGFNSKATFNRAFRKETGMSPGEYNQQMKRKNT